MEEVAVEKKGISIIGAFLMVALIFLLQILLFIPFDIANIILAGFGFKGINIYIDIIGEVFINIFIIYLFISRIRKKEKFNLKVKYKPNVMEYFHAIFFLIAHLLIFSNTIGILIEKIEVSQWVVDAFDEVFIDPFIAFISLCIIAPVFEEIIYRGIILEQLSKRYSMTTSILVSGLLFGLIHANIHQGVNAFFIGIIVGFIYIKTNSLILCIFWHFANNFLVFISSMCIPENVSGAESGFSIVQLVFGIILLMVAYIFFATKGEESELKVENI